ncbi:MAG: hypothetical protein GQ565_08945 [Candidatus Aegiribacteria sp.]|nr:hypothetical protein [Candidatus Aegiribacteria sp.]
MIDVKGSHIMIEVDRSWTEYAEPGDILTFSVPISGVCIQRESMITKPPQLPFRIGESYLLLSEQGRLQGFGVEGLGFYRLQGFGWGISPSMISLAELDSLAVHIGNDAGFDSRKWFGTIAFPSGERISIQELNEYCVNSGSDEERQSPISFSLQNNYLHVERPVGMPWSRTHHIHFFSVLDSVVGSRFYQTSIPRGTVMSTQWVINWIKGRDLSITVPVLDCCPIREIDIQEPTSLKLSGFGIFLYLSEHVMYFDSNFPEIPYQEGTISIISSSFDSLGNYSTRLPRIRLDFPELVYEPGIPYAFTIESALCSETEILVYLFYSDSLNSKFYPAFRFSISLDEFTRSSL